MNKNYQYSLQQIAKAYRLRIKPYIKHCGELGRLHENIIKDLLKQVTPGKCSIGTGFIINSFGEISPQCDIVVYDDFFNKPLIPDMSAKLFPIESVYAFIEVKTTLRRQNLISTLENIKKIRKMATKGRFYAGVVGPITVPPRSYIITFDVDNTIVKDRKHLDVYLQKLCDDEHKHFHGLLVLEKDLFIRREPNRFTPPQFDIHHSCGLAEFLRIYLLMLSQDPMATMDITKYVGHEGDARQVEKKLVSEPW